MRKHRTIYFNDARHYYLFVFEPPMTMEEAWLPIDEVAGTAVDTFIYGVERGDGIFYPSKVAPQFGVDRQPFTDAYQWRTWHNMKGLEERGLDPLKVLVDRAHEKGMEFIASLRMSGWAGIPSEFKIGHPQSGANFALEAVRDHRLAVLTELATDYPTDGIELDFACTPYYFKPEEARQNLSVMTEHVRRIAEMARGRPSGPAVVGARVQPTEEMNLNSGLDVKTWLKEGLVDYVAALHYQTFLLDPFMPIDWLVQAAHDADASVYGMLQPFARDESRRFYTIENTTPAMMRAAASNLLDKGVDGLYAWFLKWPLGDAQRNILTELGDPDLIAEGTKQYHMRRRDESEELGYHATIPLEIASPDPAKRYPLPFYVSDDIEGKADRIRAVTLRLNVGNLVSADRIALLLNGRSLDSEPVTRSFGGQIAPYEAQWLDIELQRVRPRKGDNVLEIALESRANGLEGAIRVEDFELIVEYGPYPSGL